MTKKRREGAKKDHRSLRFRAFSVLLRPSSHGELIEYLG